MEKSYQDFLTILAEFSKKDMYDFSNGFGSISTADPDPGSQKGQIRLWIRKTAQSRCYRVPQDVFRIDSETLSNPGRGVIGYCFAAPGIDGVI